MRLQDVARSAGVSAATVSRIIAGAGGAMPETVALVESAVAKLGYVPMNAATVRNGFPPGVLHGHVGFVVPDSRVYEDRTHLTSVMMRGMCEVLNERHVNLSLAHTNEDGRLPAALSPNRMDGLILKNWPDDERVLENLPDLPVVMCLESARLLPPRDHAQFDLEVLGEIIADYASARGVSRVASVTDMGQWTQQRGVEYVAAGARQAGKTVTVLKPEGSRHVTETAATIGRLLALDPFPELVFVFGTAELLPALQVAFAARGIRPGKDVEVVGETYERKFVEGLTMRKHVILPRRELGAAAAELLLSRLAYPRTAARRVLVAPRLADPGEQDA